MTNLINIVGGGSEKTVSTINLELNSMCLHDLSVQIRNLIHNNNHVNKRFSKETIDKFMRAAETIDNCTNMVQNINWLITTAQDEETFNKRWESDVK